MVRRLKEVLQPPPRRGARLLLLLLAAGLLLAYRTNVLLGFPLAHPAWFLWHPLLAPFHPEVRTDASGWWMTAQCWAWPAVLAAIVALLRRPRWMLLFVLVLAAGIPAMHQLLDAGPRWVVAAIVAVLAWRGHPAWAMVLASLALLAPPLAAAVVVTGYGLNAGGSPVLLAGALLVGVLLAAWTLRTFRDGVVLLPPVALIALTLGSLAVGPAASRHHEAPAAPGDCVALDVKVLQSFAGDPGTPLWAVSEVPQGIAVGGNDRLWLLDDAGEVRSTLHVRCGRPFALAPQGDAIVGTFQCGVLGWEPGHEAEPWFQVAGFDEPMHVLPLDGAVLTASNQYPVALRADGRRVDARYYGDPSGIHLFGITRTRDRVFAWDGDTLAEIDPASLDPVRTREFGSLDRAIAIAGGGRLLGLARPFAGRVEVVDGDSLQTLREIDIGFAPRYLAIDLGDRFLAAVDFLSETLVVHRIDDGSLVGRYRVGPRPRGVQWSARLSAFLGVSACGAWERPVPVPGPAPGGT